MRKFKDFLQDINIVESLQHGEGYQEAGELMGQKDPDIMAFIAKIGIPHKPPGSHWSDEDDNYAINLGKIIDSIPSNATIEPNQIPNLKNLANKPGQEQLPQQLSQISGQPDAAQKYIDFMQKRDSGEGRNRGYNVADLVKKVQSGDYSPPVLIKGGSGLVVVGGRTRLYAALALGIPIKVKVLDENIKQKMPQQQTPQVQVASTIYDKPILNEWLILSGLLK